MPACLPDTHTHTFFSNQYTKNTTHQLKPEKVYFVGGFGVLSKWIPVEEYEVRFCSGAGSLLLKGCFFFPFSPPLTTHHQFPRPPTTPHSQAADPDVLAHEVSRIVARINHEHEPELRLMCRHFLGAREVDQVQASSVDRLGIDLRVTTGELTDEYRIGFREKVSSTEDAKSELVKMFQEAWERENGCVRACVPACVPASFFFFLCSSRKGPCICVSPAFPRSRPGWGGWMAARTCGFF